MNVNDEINGDSIIYKKKKKSSDLGLNCANHLSLSFLIINLFIHCVETFLPFLIFDIHKSETILNGKTGNH